MKLQRWHVARGGLDQGDHLDERGDWVRWADVDALLFEIRRLLDAERGENYTMMDYGPHRNALDVLLADGGG